MTVITSKPPRRRPADAAAGSGRMIIVDFIDMVPESNRDLEAAQADRGAGPGPHRHQVSEVTSLGLGR